MDPSLSRLGFYQSSQLEVLTNVIHTFTFGRKNWTRGKDRSVEMEKNFAKDLFNVLCCVKCNIDWSVGGKPPIDRVVYELLMKCYDFEPFQKHWSRRKTMRAVGCMKTSSFITKQSIWTVRLKWATRSIEMIDLFTRNALGEIICIFTKSIKESLVR